MPELTKTRDHAAAPDAPRAERPRRRISIAEGAVVLALVLLLILPLPADNLQMISQLNQVVTVLASALSVYVMMRLKLLHFGVPAFMAVGGYSAALTAVHVTDNVVALVGVSLVVPALAAVPFGLITMRLRGTYFALVTFLIGQVVYLAIVASDGLGGTDGITGIPAPTLGGTLLGDGVATLRIGLAVSLLAVVLVVVFTMVNGRRLDALRSNEVLAGSLGLRSWPVRLAAFVLSGALAGMSGFLIVNTLTTAHPSSFSTLTGVNYVAYVVVGGAASVLGPFVGTVLLVFLVVQFASEGVYAGALLGGLLIFTSLFLQKGLTGTVHDLTAWVVRRATGRSGSARPRDDSRKDQT